MNYFTLFENQLQELYKYITFTKSMFGFLFHKTQKITKFR